MMKLHTDGACILQKGVMGIGYVLQIGDATYSKYQGIEGDGTNNIAEYLALLDGIAEATKHLRHTEDNKLHIYSDSQLMVNQILGSYKVKNEHLKLLRDDVLKALQRFDWKIEWIPREYNAEADKLSKQGIEAALSAREESGAYGNCKCRKFGKGFREVRRGNEKISP